QIIWYDMIVLSTERLSSPRGSTMSSTAMKSQAKLGNLKPYSRVYVDGMEGTVVGYGWCAKHVATDKRDRLYSTGACDCDPQQQDLRFLFKDPRTGHIRTVRVNRRKVYIIP